MQKRLLFLALIVALALTVSVVPAMADGLTLPNVTTGLPGWTVDRYAPAVFSYLPSFEGVSNVIDLGIGTSGDSANRASTGQEGTFYNTQGEGAMIGSAPAGSDFSVFLYIPGSWSNSANGDVRTDLWVNGNPGNGPYGILGFTNFGTNNRVGQAGPTFQYWDDASGTWTVATAAIDYNNWNRLDIQYTGTGFNYSVNGVLVGAVTEATAGAPMTQVLLEAYNYNDPNFGTYYGNSSVTNNSSVPYDAYYANTPEPATFGLFGFGLLGLVAAARRKFRA